MGGLLARVYLNQAAPYKTMHRLFTLNTPHLGSEWANLILSLRDNVSPLKRFLFVLAMELAGKPIHLGAIDDLAVGSEALMALPDTRVLSHALVGVGGSEYVSDTLSFAPGPFGDTYRTADFLIGPSDLFKGLQHDLVVSRNSQIGGLPLGTFSIFEGFESIHSEATGSTEYSNRLFCPQIDDVLTCPNGSGSDLINAQGTGQFSFFPTPSSLRSSRPLTTLKSDRNPGGGKLVEGGIRITSPQPGQSIASGSTIQVTVESVAPFAAARVMLVTQVGVQIREQPPFEFMLTVPDDHAGALEFSAIAEDTAGNYATAESVGTIGQVQASLTAVVLAPTSVFLNRFDDRRQLTLTGEFADGIDRNLTDPSTGTSYSSSNPAVVSVSNDGLLRPHRDGVATIIADNDGLQDSITVEVMNIGDLMFRDGFEAEGLIAVRSVQ